MVAFLSGSIRWVILNSWVWGEISPFCPFRKNKKQTDKLMLTEAEGPFTSSSPLTFFDLEKFTFKKIILLVN